MYHETDLQLKTFTPQSLEVWAARKHDAFPDSIPGILGHFAAIMKGNRLNRSGLGLDDITDALNIGHGLAASGGRKNITFGVKEGDEFEDFEREDERKKQKIEETKAVKDAKKNGSGGAETARRT